MGVPTGVPDNPSVTWLFVVVILLVVLSAAWLIRYLFKQVIAGERERTADAKEALGLERERSAILEARVLATIPVAEAAAQVLGRLPDPRAIQSGPTT